MPVFLLEAAESAVLPTGIFLCQIFEVWRFLEVVGINIFGLAYLSNLAYFSTTRSFFDICKMLKLSKNGHFGHFCFGFGRKLWKKSGNPTSASYYYKNSCFGECLIMLHVSTQNLETSKNFSCEMLFCE